MIAVSSEYETRNEAPARTPAYYVAFGGDDTLYSTHRLRTAGFAPGPVFDSAQFDLIIPGPVPVAGVATKAYIQHLRSTGGRIRPQDGSSETGDFDFDIIDKDNEITALLARGIIGPSTIVTLYAGFADMLLSDFAVWMKARVEDAQQVSAGVYHVTAAESTAFISKTIFQTAVTKLVAPFWNGGLWLDPEFITWGETGDFTISGSLAYAHSTGVGEASITAGFFVPLRTKAIYGLTYDVSGVSGTVAAQIQAGTASAATPLVLTNGTGKTLEFEGHADIGTNGFVLEATSSSGGFTLDNLRLELLTMEVESIAFFSGAGSFFDDGFNDYGFIGVGDGDQQETYSYEDVLVNPPRIRLKVQAGNILSQRFGTGTYLDAAGSNTTPDGTTWSNVQLHAENSQVREFLRIGELHPLDIALGVLQKTGKWGLDIAAEDIDTDSFDDIKALNAVLRFDFLIDRPEDGKRWLEREIFLPLNCYLVTANDGRLSLRKSTFPIGVTTVGTIDEDAMLEPPIWRGNYGQTINSLTITFGHREVGRQLLFPARPRASHLSDDFGERVVIEDAASIEAFGRRSKLLAFRGLRRTITNAGLFVDPAVAGSSYAVNTQTFLSDYSSLFFGLYANGSPSITVVTTLDKHLIEQGDYVSVTSRFLPNRGTGELGVTAVPMQVVRRDPDFLTGRITWELQWADLFMYRIPQVAVVDLGNSSGAGGLGSWQNPTGVKILVVRVEILIETVEAGQTVDAGVAGSASEASDDLIDGGSLATLGAIDNIDQQGTNGRSSAVMNAAGSGGDWITFTPSGTPSALDARAYIEYFNY